MHRIRHPLQLPYAQRLQYLDVLEQFHDNLRIALVHYRPKCAAVQLPERPLRPRNHRRRSRLAVHKRQLAERRMLPCGRVVCVHQLRGRVALEHKHVELAFLHHVKVIPALALPNDHFTRDDVPLDHNIEKEQALHHVEVAEQKIALHCVLQQFDLRLRLCRQLGRHVLSVILIIATLKRGGRKGLLEILLAPCLPACKRVPLRSADIAGARLIPVSGGRPCRGSILHAGEFYDNNRDIVRPCFILQPQVVRLSAHRERRFLRVIVAGHHIDHGLAAHKLEYAVTGQHQKLHVMLQILDGHLRVRHHADALRGHVADAAREGRAGIHPVVCPQPRRVTVVLLLRSPALRVRVLQPLQLVQRQHSRAILLHPCALISPEGRLI
mmetsp:Transcript_9524/g.17163  ORF Transcript_9524/g.17163 Transcript_9524/m.17163 type:complete len:382 (-) Transcript_9524:1094-2239(-)